MIAKYRTYASGKMIRDRPFDNLFLVAIDSLNHLYKVSVPMKTVEEVREMMREIRIATFATVDMAGNITSRPMALQLIDELGQAWFFTSKDSQKAHDISRDIHVNLSFSDHGANTYVCATGMGQLVYDKQKMQDLFDPAVKAWYPEGLSDPNLCLLKVDIQAAEYWTATGGKFATYIEMARAAIMGDTPKNTENEIVSM
jgi:general stress protein 26